MLPSTYLVVLNGKAHNISGNKKKQIWYILFHCSAKSELLISVTCESSNEGVIVIFWDTTNFVVYPHNHKYSENAAGKH